MKNGVIRLRLGSIYHVPGTIWLSALEDLENIKTEGHWTLTDKEGNHRD